MIEIRGSIDSIVFGESRAITVYGAEPIEVEISCFVKEPPPPGYRPCPECGTLVVPTGGSFKIHAVSDMLGHSDQVVVDIRDADGDRKRLNVHVDRGMDGAIEEEEKELVF